MPPNTGHHKRHVFISYVREDAHAVEQLSAALESAGVEVWLDRDRILPGARWQHVIRRAIQEGAFFVACFSQYSAARERSYMNEELVIAIEEMRKHPTDRAWFLPVLLSPDTLPERDIGAGETLSNLHYVALYEHWDEGVKRLVSAIEPEAYEEPPVRARRERFERPSATTSLHGSFVEGFLDASFSYVTSVAEEILRYLTARTLLPSRYLFLTQSGAEGWLSVCSDPENRSHLDSLRFWFGPDGEEVANLLYDEVGRSPFAHLSLGCGDGRKDASLVNHWLSGGAEITYYPYDVSPLLLRHATRQALDTAPLSASNRLSVRAIAADFDQVETASELLQQHHPEAPIIVTVFGGSFGSMETALLRRLRKLMTSEDVIALEIPLAAEKDYGSIETRSAAQFYFHPLAESLGVPFDPSRMTIHTRRNVSSIPDTTTSVVSYQDVDIRGTRFNEVGLAALHHYSEDAFLGAVRRSGFEVFDRRIGGENEQILVCMARPR